VTSGGHHHDGRSLVERLAEAGCVAPDLEAVALRSAAPDAETLEAWTRRRLTGEPLAWIVGSVTFGGRRIRVDRGVYVPRPQTEALVSRAIALLPDRGAAADLCTGSGAVASCLAAAARATVVGVDIDPAAAGCARRNGVPTIVGDLGDALRTSAFDVVTAVAPYVPTAALPLLASDVRAHEPMLAFDGGRTGLELVERTIESASRLLRPGGRLLLELGGEQDGAIEPSLAANGFVEVSSWVDEDGDLRGVAARRG
jgi:release factor glutamine methyltransferase